MKFTIRDLFLVTMIAAFFATFTCPLFSCDGEVEGPPSPRAEWFKVTNSTDESITFHLRAGGRGTSNDWQMSIKIMPGKTEPIPLGGFEPFHIAIRQRDGTVYLADKASIRSWMEECRTSGRTDYSLHTIKGRASRHGFRRDDRAEYLFNATANKDAAGSSFTLVFHDPEKQQALDSLRRKLADESREKYGVP